ncbi:DUF3243 domain-containing protein [Lederbergia sp. NSJ-179]|uniref:DUF3243 domain-containing protein n=1 Tax=Lederbergia sp. NSJ-179 TaxID=2931402 RepID=UPI001FD2797A|nr:DUF3243 domain-containing protein [Lederbergia sp. NSJ-179]MCJ7839702.1 DUF3243 domain-containing protein [Lederbergia sp. NSJ-179]
MSVLNNWDHWKNFLGDQLDDAQDQGMSQQIIDKMAHHVGDYLANNVDPKNEQQRVLSDLWSVASEEEQQAIARVMVKLVENNNTK